MTWQPDPKGLLQIKIVLFVVCLLPLAGWIYGGFNDGLSENPVEFITRATGTWTFNFLLLTLTITPLRSWTGAHWLLKLRRMLGLFTFFYACLHLACFIGLEHFFDFAAMARDILKRPFITIGFAGFCLLVPLAATSNAWSVRRLGGKRWQELHRSIYLIGILACVHYFWLVKATALVYPIQYSLLLCWLLGWRIRQRLQKSRAPNRSYTPKPTPSRSSP